MGLEELQLGNTLRAKATAIGAFKKFLKAEQVTEEYIKDCIECDESGKCFVAVMDKFGMYLAFSSGAKGKQLARNTSLQYYRQAKLWMLDQFPQHRASLESRLLKMGKTLDSFCLKREGGGYVSKATPYLKADLKRMLGYLYSNACCETDYQDAAVLCLLWYLFGRASDLAMLQKQNVSVDAGGVLFLRLIRMKTSEEQGLSLFPDADFHTCPLVATALALIVQSAPTQDLIGNLPLTTTQLPTTLSADIPLVELLNGPAAKTTLATPTAKGTGTSPTIYSHVNRILDRVALIEGVGKALSSHSFRRGGAQHANGCEELTERWIFDRASWDMSTTNKGFNYIFNTSKEDHKVAKVLAGYKPKEDVTLQDLSSFDSQTLERIGDVQRLLFASCFNLATNRLNVDRQVIQVLTATVFRHFPHLKALNPGSPAITRIENAVTLSGNTFADLRAWSSHLALPAGICSSKNVTATATSAVTSNSNPSNEQKDNRSPSCYH